MFIFICLVAQVHFSVLEREPYVGDVLRGPAGHSTLVTRAICSRSSLYVGCMGHSVVMEPTIWHITVHGVTKIEMTLCDMLKQDWPQPGWLSGPAFCGVQIH